jgi:regulator of sirC expression with transglutaminase-like and TPR domain
LEEIRLARLEKEVWAYSRQAAPDLEEGLFLLARFKSPEATEAAYGPILERMAAGLRKRVSDSVEPGEVVAAVRRYFYGEEGFCGNRWDYYDPDNSFIHRVLERKTGIPISLASAMLLVTRRVGLPFYGVGMPGHFLLRYGSGENGILIDPFNSGEVLEREAIRTSFESRGLEFRDSYLAPMGTREILGRTLRNLIAIYRQRGETERVARLNRFHRIVLQGSSST